VGKLYSSKEVADYIISKGIKQTNQSLTNFKLQKILYYSQGFYFKEYNKPLIKEEFKMFRHGVAIKEELERYWEFNFIEIDKTGNKLKDCKIKEEDKEFLDEVWNIFKNFTGKQLDYLVQYDLPEEFRNYNLEIRNIKEPEVIAKNSIKYQFNSRYKKREKFNNNK